jgi:MarR family transcriptional regulator, 2-MHQ and catechol-resistance regulon repressor
VRTDRREGLYHDLLRQTTAMAGPFEKEASAASLLLSLTCDIQQSFFTKMLGRYGLARSSFNVLALLRHGWPNGLQLSEIGELLITSRANITGLIDHLQSKGYVTRVVDHHDRRARLAKITRRGEDLVDEVLPLHQKLAAELYAHLSLEEILSLNEVLKKIRQSPALRNDVSQRAGGPARPDFVGVP